MDTKTVKMMAENMQEFTEHAENVIDIFLSVNNRWNRGIESIEYYSDELYVSYDASRCGCCRDTESITMPMEYLWEEDWKEKELARMENEKKEKERLAKRKEAKEEKDKKKAKEEKDKKDYTRLKKKFEGEK